MRAVAVLLLLVALALSTACGSIHYAALGNSTDSLRELLDQGINVDEPDSTGATPLMMAVFSCRKIEAVELLLERGANINAKDGFGRTALMQAAQQGHMQCVQLLLGKGADPLAVNHFRRTAAMEADKEGYQEIANFIYRTVKEYYFDNTPNTDNRIRSIAVLPFVNQTNDVEGPAVVQEEFANGLRERFYEAKYPREVNQLLKDQMGITLGSQLDMAPAQQICQTSAVDGLLYGSLDEYVEKITGVYNTKRVQIRVKLIDCRTGSLVWKNGAGAKTIFVPNQKSLKQLGDAGTAISAVGAISTLGGSMSDAVDQNMQNMLPLFGERVSAPWVILASEPHQTSGSLGENIARGMIKTVAEQATGLKLVRERKAAIAIVLDGYLHSPNRPGWSRLGIPRGPISTVTEPGKR